MAIKLSASRLDLGNARLDNADLRGYSELQNALGNVSGATTIDLSLGAVVTATITAATTFSVTNIPSATQYVSFTLVLTNGGRFTTTWMSGTRWQNSVAPTLSVTGTDVLTFFTTDNGTTWRGAVPMPYMSAGSQMFAWGYGYGRLGTGDSKSRSSPTQIAGTWLLFGLEGDTSLGISTSGGLYTTGRNVEGQLGIGDTTLASRDGFARVGTSSWIEAIRGSDGGQNFLAIQADSTLWSWGNNGSGSLGLGNTILRSSPTQIAGTWSSANGGRQHLTAIRSNGSLWVWGRNAYGEMAQGDVNINRSSPVQVPGTWTAAVSGLDNITALKTDGTLWSWGYNGTGALGLGDVAHRSSPVQIPGTWSAVASAGGGWSMMAIKNNGSLWTWGYNTFGGLGLGHVALRSSPTQIAGTWTGCWFIRQAGFALRSDYALFSFGRNDAGQLGLGDTVHRSSPVQIPGTWRNIGGGGRQHAMGIKKAA